MSINQITTANTFGQLITAVAALIAVANNFTDGPQSQTGSTWTFTNANVGVNVIGTLLSTNANVGILNVSNANVTNETVGRSNISTANVTVANVVGATITNLISTTHLSANVNVSVLLQVSDRANIFSANIQTANIGSLAVTTLAVTELTVPVLNASFANITTLSVTGTSQHNALIATLITTTNANVGILNASTANISNCTMVTANASFANITVATIGTLSITTETIGTGTFGVLNASFANITAETVGTMNVSTANITNLFANVANLLSCNIASGNVTGRMNVASNPTANLEVSTKAYTDIAANVLKQLYATKGDILAANSVANPINVAIGTNGQCLVVDTQTSTSLRWANRGPAQTFRNLSLGTSSADKIANGTIIIFDRADEIVMDDGEAVYDWPRASINISANGAGALDTGVVLANTWYELYAIRKRSDATRNFVLHRALDRNVDQNTAGVAQFAHNATVQVNRVTAPNVRVAQSFVANVSGPLTSFEVRLFRTATPVGNVWITLHANTAGDPAATPLATSRRYDVARAQTTHQAVRFVFDVTANVVATNSYFAVAQTDFTASDTNFITLQASTTAYFNGVTKGNTGAAWVTLNPGIGTLIFKEYVEANNTALTYPAGFDQKCMIGYAATDQTSKLREYRQRDRTITTFFGAQWMGYASLQITIPEVADLVYVVPPVTCDVSFQVWQASGVTQGAHIGLLNCLDIPGSGYGEVQGGFTVGSSGTQGAVASPPFPPVWIEHQACMVHVGVAVTKFYVQSVTW